MDIAQMQALFESAIAGRKPAGDGFMTTRDYQKLTGWGKSRVLHFLGELKASGHLELGTRIEQNLNGVQCPRDVYRIKWQKTKKKEGRKSR